MKTIKKLLTILLITFATTAGAQNNWYAPSVFHEKVSFKKEVSQTDGSDSLTLRTIGANSTLNHGLGTLLLNNSKAAIGLFNTTGYRVAASSTNIQLQQGSTDSIIVTFSGDTAHADATVASWDFNPPLDANSVTGFWKTDGNAGTTPPTDFIGTTDKIGVVLKSDNWPQIVFGNNPDISDTSVYITGDTAVLEADEFGIIGKVKIQDGTQGTDKVLTCINSSGNALWQATAKSNGTFTDPATAAIALGSGKPYILSTTIGVVAVLLQAITP